MGVHNILENGHSAWDALYDATLSTVNSQYYAGIGDLNHSKGLMANKS
jgi:hypothetical protein